MYDKKAIVGKCTWNACPGCKHWDEREGCIHPLGSPLIDFIENPKNSKRKSNVVICKRFDDNTP